MQPQLQSYITENLSKGLSKETILNNLVSAGWSKDQVTPALYPPAPHAETVQIHTSLSTNPRLSSWLLRIGLAFVFIYAAVALSLNPAEGMHFLPGFVAHIIPAKIFLTLFALYEIVLAIWLLSGRWYKYSGLLAAVTIFGITSLNLSDFTVLFRNVAIVFAGLALAMLPRFGNNK